MSEGHHLLRERDELRAKLDDAEARADMWLRAAQRSDAEAGRLRVVVEEAAAMQDMEDALAVRRSAERLLAPAPPAPKEGA